MEDAIYDKINVWLEGNMSAGDKKAFEAEMENNPDLAREAKLAKDVLAAIGEKEVVAFRKQMSDIMSEKIPTIKKNNKTKNIALIIGGLLIIGLFAYLFFNKKEKENPVLPIRPVALYDKYFAAPEQLISIENTRKERGLDSLEKNVGLLIRELNEQFQEKNYQKAFITLSRLKYADTENLVVQEKDLNFSKGLIYLVTDQPQLAIGAFEEANKNMVWDNVQWYMAAAYIRLGKFGDAEAILEKLKNGDNPAYKEKSGQVLLDMERNQ